jgi:CheY-like chemotaxis protein
VVQQTTLHRPLTLRQSTVPIAVGALDRFQPRITVVHDDPEFTALIVDIFSGQFDVTAVGDTSPNTIADTLPQLLIVEVGAPNGGLTGWEFVRLARRHRVLCHVPIVLCTTHPIELDSDGRQLAEFSDVHLLVLPFGLDAFERLVHSILPPALSVVGPH